MSLVAIFAGLDLWSVELPLPVALAAVATLGYLVGRREQPAYDGLEVQSRRAIKQAQAVVRNLERISKKVRQHLAEHHVSVARFKDRVHKLGQQQDEAAWKELYQEAKQIVGPTLRLSAELAHAYDQIRLQSSQLMSFAEVRTDALTGLSNRRVMDETLTNLFAMKNRYGLIFSVAIFDIDHFKQVNDQQGHLAGDRLLQAVANVLEESARETDIVTRYGGEEFVVVMPETDLAGAGNFSERVRRRFEEQLSVTVSAGFAAALDGETPSFLLERADTALYGAKSAGRNRVFQHDGERAEPAAAASPACAG